MYPLDRAGDPRPVRIIRSVDRSVDGDWPKDHPYFEFLAEGLSYLRIEPEDKLMYAMLEPLGIVPGRPFRPGGRTRAILARAA